MRAKQFSLLFMCILICLYPLKAASKDVVVNKYNTIKYFGTNDIGYVTLQEGKYSEGSLIPASVTIPDNFSLVELTIGSKTYTDIEEVKAITSIPAYTSNINNISGWLKSDPIDSAEKLVAILNTYKPDGAIVKDGVVYLQKAVVFFYNNSSKDHLDTLSFDGAYGTRSITIKSTSVENSLRGPHLAINGMNIIMDDFVCSFQGISINSGSLYIKGSDVGAEEGLGLYGNTAELNIESGNISTIKVEEGTVSIGDGANLYDIDMYGGNLNVSGGYFNKSINILDLCSVHLSGGYFGDESVFVKSGVTFKPDMILEEGYSFYSRIEEVQPDVLIDTDKMEGRPTTIQKMQGETKQRIEGNMYSFGQVKLTESMPNKCFEDAQNADVGISGADVEVKDGDYFVKTEKGLVWIAYMLNNFSLKNYGTIKFENALTNGSEFFLSILQGKHHVRLMRDMDLSDYNWIPFCIPSTVFFDGQGYCIKNLEVRQFNAGFILRNSGVIANLAVEGNVFYVRSNYITSNTAYIGGLVASNVSGTIVNCSFYGNIILSLDNIYTTTYFQVGGLVGHNSSGFIENSSMNGQISCDYSHTLFSNTGTEARIGGIIGESSDGGLDNCYFNGYVPQSYRVENPINARYSIVSDNFVGYKDGDFVINNCLFSPESPEKLNEKVKEYNDVNPTATEDTYITGSYYHGRYKSVVKWSDWISKKEGDNNIIIHANRHIQEAPVITDVKFTILKEGNGEFEAAYTYLKDVNDPNSAIDTIIYANTSVEVVNNKDFTITATPSEGYELDRVVKILDGKEKDTLDMKAGEPLAYNVVVADTLKAYFKPIEIIPEPEPEVITTDSVLTASQVNGKDLVVDNDKEKYLELEASGIDVPSLTINAGSSAVLELSGTNDLGTVTNNGTLIVQNVNGSLNAAIQNNGTFTDYTGKVTEVEGYASLSIEPITDNANDGETVTLVATAIADGTVSFQWQRQEDDGSWTNIEQTELMTRAMMLRAASEQTDELIVPLSEAGWYRCLITYKKGNTSTTLVAYAEVSDDGEVEEPENPEEDNPNLPDYPDYYNIYIETCEGVEATLSTKIVREGNSMTFTLETEEGYTDENITVKFKRSMFGYWETATPDEKGVYQIHNIYADIYITVEGVEEENPTGIKEIGGIKVYAKDGSIYVQTPKQEQVLIISISGAIVKNEKQVGLQRYDGLQRGVYVVKVGKQVFKIRN